MYELSWVSVFSLETPFVVTETQLVDCA
jgi:hypothetical protein